MNKPKHRWLEEYIDRRVERSRRGHSPKAAKIQNIAIILSILIFIFLIVLGQMW